MPVVSMVSSKGGAGKTTTALIIAGEIASAGRTVILVDADPNQPLVAWAARPGKPDNIQVVIDESAETIVDTIAEAKTVPILSSSILRAQQPTASALPSHNPTSY